MTVLSFTIRFRGPFHVATGTASAGLDRTIDRAIPLPASSLKGLMRAEALGALGFHPTVVDDVFGTHARPCPWAWSDAQFDTDSAPNVSRLARIRIHPGLGGQVVANHLMLGEHCWADTAEFEIELIDPLSDVDVRRHTLVLRAAATSVLSLGGARNRGEGWVAVTPRIPDRSWTAEEIHELAALRTGGAA